MKRATDVLLKNSIHYFKVETSLIADPRLSLAYTRVHNRRPGGCRCGCRSLSDTRQTTSDKPTTLLRRLCQ